MEEGFFLLGDGAREGFIYDFLAGIDYFGFGGLHLARWFAGIAFILFGTGLWLERRRQIMVFEMVRFDSRKKWWNRRFWKLFQTGAAGCFLYEFCMLGLDFLLGKEKPAGGEMILILLLWMVHMMVMVSVFGLLELTAMREAVSALLFVMEVSSFILGFFIRNLSKYMFGCWGMYLQSSEVEEVFGFSPVVVFGLEILMILTVWRAGARMTARKDTRWSM